MGREDSFVGASDAPAAAAPATPPEGVAAPRPSGLGAAAAAAAASARRRAGAAGPASAAGGEPGAVRVGSLQTLLAERAAPWAAMRAATAARGPRSAGGPSGVSGGADRIARAVGGDEAWHERPAGPPPVARFRVAFAPRVVVREAPSTSALAVGFERFDAEVRAVARRGPWVLLQSEEEAKDAAAAAAAAAGRPAAAGRGAGTADSEATAAGAAAAAAAARPRAATLPAAAQAGAALQLPRERWMLTWAEEHGTLLQPSGGAHFTELPHSRPALTSTGVHSAAAAAAPLGRGDAATAGAQGG